MLLHACMTLSYMYVQGCMRVMRVYDFTQLCETIKPQDSCKMHS